MGKIIIILLMLILVNGCASFYDPYQTSFASDPYKEIREYNDSFFDVYHSDLRTWVGKDLADLDQVFTLRGDSSLDVYGTGTVVHEVINPVPELGVHARLIFYVKNNKIYNVVKE